MIVKDLLKEINSNYFLNFKKELNPNFRKYYKYKLNDNEKEKINKDLKETLFHLENLKEKNTDSNLAIIENIDLIDNSLIYSLGFFKNEEINNVKYFCLDDYSEKPNVNLYAIDLLDPEIILGLQISNVLLNKYSKKFIICLVLDSLFTLDFDYNFDVINNTRISFLKRLKDNLFIENNVNNDGDKNYKTAEEVFSELKEKYGLKIKEENPINNILFEKEVFVNEKLKLEFILKLKREFKERKV